jgi:hypothetical protein
MLLSVAQRNVASIAINTVVLGELLAGFKGGIRKTIKDLTMTTTKLRGIDEPLSQTLKELARNRGVSLNTLALRLIREATGIDKRKRTVEHHDLDALAGTWNENDELEFKNATRSLEAVDEEMWH